MGSRLLRFAGVAAFLVLALWAGALGTSSASQNLAVSTAADTFNSSNGGNVADADVVASGHKDKHNPTDTPMPTSTSAPAATATATSTATPTATGTATPTEPISEPPTVTATRTATETSIAPATASPTPIAPATATRTATSAITVIAATSTATATGTATATATVTSVPTEEPLASPIYLPLALVRHGPPGPFTAVAVAPSNGAIVYAANANGQIYFSRDGGRSWSSAELSPAVTQLAVHPQNPDIVLAGLAQSEQGGGGIMFSNNGGVTWTAAAGIGRARIGDIAFAPSNGAVVYAGTVDLTADAADEGVYVSQDAGATWQLSQRISAGVTSLLVEAGNASVAYLGTTADKLYRTTDGQTWSQDEGFPAADVRDLAGYPHNAGKILAATSSGLAYYDGTRWYSFERPGGMDQIVIDGLDNRHAYGISDGVIFRSTNFGWNGWVAQPTPFGRANTFALQSDGTGLYVAADTGLFRSPNLRVNGQQLDFAPVLP